MCTFEIGVGGVEDGVEPVSRRIAREVVDPVVSKPAPVVSRMVSKPVPSGVEAGAGGVEDGVEAGGWWCRNRCRLVVSEPVGSVEASAGAGAGGQWCRSWCRWVSNGCSRKRARMDGWMDGWMNRWMDGSMDGMGRSTRGVVSRSVWNRLVAGVFLE